MNKIVKILALTLVLAFTVSMVACVADTSENIEPVQTEPETPRAKQHVHTFTNEQCKDAPCTECGKSVDPTHKYKLVSETKKNLYKCATSTYKCANCNAEKTVNTSEVLSPDKLDIPVVYFTGSLDGISKENELVLEVEYKSENISFSSYAKMKTQGALSQAFPKKNFTVKLYEDKDCTDKNKVDLGWGKEYKYCMKANYIDASHARNVVSAQLYSQIVAERVEETHELATLAANYGVIDGYPVLMYLNGEFYGLYTMNIPKDKWMMGMKDSSEQKQAMLMANDWTGSCYLNEPIPEGMPTESGWELEYCSTEDTAWVTDSFNRFIDFIVNCDDAEFKDRLSDYIDVDAAIDNLIYTFFLCAADNMAKNILWITYDGEIWFPTMYDMDGVLGIYWNGTHTSSSDKPLLTVTPTGELEDPLGLCNLLWKRLISNYASEIKLRYFELREGVLSTENIEKTFSEFFSKIPESAYVSEAARWQSIPNLGENHFEYIMSFVNERVAILDGIFSKVNS